MTIERQRQLVLYRGYDRDYVVRIPGTKKKVNAGERFAYTEVKPASFSFHGETIQIGKLRRTDEVTGVSDDTLNVHVKNSIDIDPVVASDMGDLLAPELVAKLTPQNRIGDLKGHKINGGFGFPDNRRIQTIFRYKPSK